jgi:hypothetical protein
MIFATTARACNLPTIRAIGHVSQRVVSATVGCVVACAHFCAAVFGADTPAAGQCTSDAAHGTGLCATCGTTAPADICCTRTAAGMCDPSRPATCCSVPANATVTCREGTCGFACKTGYADCDNDPRNGCEVDLTSDPLHCGACSSACPIRETCYHGTCRCVFPGEPPDLYRSVVPSTCCDNGNQLCGAPDQLSKGSACELVKECPSGYTRCVGTDAGSCAACCPSGTTCDASGGFCRQGTGTA